MGQSPKIHPCPSKNVCKPPLVLLDNQFGSKQLHLFLRLNYWIQNQKHFPKNLLKNIDGKNILLEKKVVKIGEQKDIDFEDGKKLRTNNIVLTV